jgi:hypothetical protein
VDITARQHFVEGTDIQGLIWAHIPMSRHRYRQHRIHNFRNYENLNVSHSMIAADIITVEEPRSLQYYRFVGSRLHERCHIMHFQLRHLLSAVTTQDLFYGMPGSIRYYNTVTRSGRTVVDVGRMSAAGGGLMRVSCLSVKGEHITAGGMLGELVYSRWSHDTGEVSPVHIRSLTDDPNSLTNHVDVNPNRSGGSDIRSFDCVSAL